MLDDLSQKDPEAYKKFIQNNMQKGKEMMKENAAKNTIKKQLSPSDFVFSLRLKGSLSNKELVQNENERFLISAKEQEKKKKIEKEVKVYLNIFKDDTVEKSDKQFDNLMKLVGNKLQFNYDKDTNIKFVGSKLLKKENYNQLNLYLSFLLNKATIEAVTKKQQAGVFIFAQYMMNQVNNAINSFNHVFEDQERDYGFLELKMVFESLKLKDKFKTKDGNNVYAVKVDFIQNPLGLDKNTAASKKKEEIQFKPKITEEPVMKQKKPLIEEVATKKMVISVLNEDFRDDKYVKSFTIEEQETKTIISTIFHPENTVSINDLDIDLEDKRLTIKYKDKEIIKELLSKAYDTENLKAKFYKKTHKLKINLTCI